MSPPAPKRSRFSPDNPSHPLVGVRHFFRLAALATLLALVEAFYVLTVSAGVHGEWPGYMAYYDLLAEGFRAGHLYIALDPSPQLLSQANPLDSRFADYWLGDASLYGGHFYLYWGPLPALLLAVVKSLFHIKKVVAEQYLVFWAFSLCAVATMWLLDSMRRRLFPRLPYPLFALSALACALGSPVPSLLASATVYQAAIASGQAFVTVGLCFAFAAVSESGRRRPRAWKLSAAGAAWAGAIACRMTLIPGVAVLVVATALLAQTPTSMPGRRWSWRWGAVMRIGAWVAWPVAAGIGGLLLYNQQRFGAWLEFGTSVQMTTWPFRFSPRYFLVNLHQYLMRPPHLSCRFPFVAPPYGAPIDDVVPRWLPFRDGYVTNEPVAGMTWAFPLVWMVPVGVAFAAPLARRVLWARERPPADLPEQTEWRRLFVWCAVVFAALGTVTFIAPLGLYLATLRYLGDIRMGVAFLGTLGLWMLHARCVRPWQRRAATLLLVVTNLTVVVVGLLLGYNGYGGHFELFNPTLAAKLRATLSLCR